MNHLYRHLRGFALALAALSLLACCNTPVDLTTNPRGYESPITPADITYEELAERYNQTVDRFDTLFARTEIEIEWNEINDDGERVGRFESGDGKFIMRRPDGTMLTLEKAGQIMLWAGSDGGRYWLFDVIDRDEKTVYVGELSRIGEPGGRRFPLPIRPDMVPHLIGLMPLPTGLDSPPPVDSYRGDYLVQIDGVRMLIDADTSRPVRVDLTNPAGFSVLTCNLSGAFPVDIEGVARGDRPTIAERAEVYVSGVESRVTLQIVLAEVDPSSAPNIFFNFEAIRDEFEPQNVESLDRPE